MELGRRINDGMGKFVAKNTVKKLIKVGKAVKGARVLILGLTFKENVGDIRNTNDPEMLTAFEILPSLEAAPGMAMKQGIRYWRL